MKQSLSKLLLTLWTPDPIILPKGKGYGHPPDAIIALPGWLSDEDVKYFTTKFDKKALLKESTITKVLICNAPLFLVTLYI